METIPSLDEEPLLVVNGSPKILRIVLEHTVLKNIPSMEDIIIYGHPETTDMKLWEESRKLNDYLSVRFAVNEIKITHSSKQAEKSIFDNVPEEKLKSMAVMLPLRHIEFHEVSEQKLRESTIKVADKISADVRNFTALVSCGSLDKLFEQSCKCLGKPIANSSLLFDCFHPGDVLKLLLQRDPLSKKVRELLGW